MALDVQQLASHTADVASVLGLPYEERARGFLAPRGSANIVWTPGKGERPPVGNIGSLRTSNELKALLKVDDWNEVHVIARGNTLIHIYNGRVFSVFVDNDTKGVRGGGVIGVAAASGPADEGGVPEFADQAV